MAEIKSAGSAAQTIATSALRAQQARMRIIAENIANAGSTSQTAGGDPYRRQIPVFKPVQVEGGEGVRMTKVTPDNSAFKLEYEPGHPSADAGGYVKMPNVDPLVEALDMREAQRAYDMDMRTLDLLRK